MRGASLVLVSLIACDRRAAITACDQDLSGAWRDADRTWLVIDHATTLEVYPGFPDGDRGNDGIDAAPRVIDLIRQADRIEGVVRQRFGRGIATCDAHVPVHVTRCHDDSLELVITEAAAPQQFAPCVWPLPGPSHVVRWNRE